MNDDEKLEIYRQRYETFRHLDRLRWQLLQLLVAIGSATALVLRSTSGAVEWWFWTLIGISLFLIAVIMLRISSGIRANGIVLKKYAEAVGDLHIPNADNEWKSVAHWLALIIGFIGVILLLQGLTLWGAGIG